MPFMLDTNVLIHLRDEIRSSRAGSPSWMARC
jgi:hypothetical protein